MPIAVTGATAPVFTVAVHYFKVQTTVTCRGVDVERWINQILRRHWNRLRKLIVGLSVSRSVDAPKSISVLQICVGISCLVFQLCHADSFPPNLTAFLGDARFKFVGDGIQIDVLQLARDWNLRVVSTLDLSALAEEKMGRPDLRYAGLRQLAREVLRLDLEMPNRIAMSNWENITLSYEQISYACAGAFLSFQIGRFLTDRLY